MPRSVRGSRPHSLFQCQAYTHRPRNQSVEKRGRLLLAVVATCAIATAVVLLVVALPNLLLSAGACPLPAVHSLNGSPPPLSLRFAGVTTTSTRTNTSWEAQEACYGLTWASLTAVVENRTGRPMASGWSLVGQTSSGVTIVTYDPVTSSWLGPSAQLIQLWDLFTVQTGGPQSNASFILVLNGMGQFSGSLSYTASGI